MPCARTSCKLFKLGCLHAPTYYFNLIGAQRFIGPKPSQPSSPGKVHKFRGRSVKSCVNDQTTIPALDESTYAKVYHSNKFVKHPDFDDVFLRWSFEDCKPHWYIRLKLEDGRRVFYNSSEGLRERIQRLHAHSEQARHEQVDLFFLAVEAWKAVKPSVGGACDRVLTK